MLKTVYRGSLWISIFLVQLSPAVSLRCLNCLNIHDVRDCMTLQECATNQKCYSYRFMESGRELYSLGCIDKVACGQSSGVVGKRDTYSSELVPYSSELVPYSSEDNITEEDLYYERGRRQNTLPCLQCCDGSDGCNNRLCSAPATNLRCMVCNDALEKAHCEKLTVCSNDELCFVQRSPHHLTQELLYQMDCMGVKQCEGLKNSFSQNCMLCCNNTDFCNYDACDNWTPTTKTPLTTTIPTTSEKSTRTETASTKTAATTKPSTTVSSITSSLISTTPAPQLVIKGPHNSSYLSHVELQCISVPMAQSYEWKFNDISVLPNGVVNENEMTAPGSIVGLDKVIISKLNETNAGIYTCIASINGQTIVTSHSVGIFNEAPTASVSKSTVTTNFALLCNVTGYPPPHTGWAFVKANQNETYVGLPNGVIVTAGEGYTIAVAPVYRPEVHDGSWYCAAGNLYGNVIKEIDIP